MIMSLFEWASKQPELATAATQARPKNERGPLCLPTARRCPALRPRTPRQIINPIHNIIESPITCNHQVVAYDSLHRAGFPHAEEIRTPAAAALILKARAGGGRGNAPESPRICPRHVTCSEWMLSCT